MLETTLMQRRHSRKALIGTCRRNLNRLAQANTASTTLTAELVGTTRVRWKPALPRRRPYSAPVRSWPPVRTTLSQNRSCLSQWNRPCSQALENARLPPKSRVALAEPSAPVFSASPNAVKAKRCSVRSVRRPMLAKVRINLCRDGACTRMGPASSAALFGPDAS